MTDQVLVAYGSKYGSTAEIAEAIGGVLTACGLDVDVRAARTVRSLDRYRAVIIGSAVYMGRWRGEALRLLSGQRQWLATHDVWLFSSGPVGEDDDDEDPAEVDRWTKPKKVCEFAAAIGAHDHVVFGGKVDTDRGALRKMIARGAPEDTRDRRDWDEIASWAERIADVLSQRMGPAP